jgi:hypothetical protein
MRCTKTTFVPARKDKRGVDLISDVLPFGRLWYDRPDHAIGYAMHYSRSHDAVINVYDVCSCVGSRCQIHGIIAFDFINQQSMGQMDSRVLEKC